MIAGLLDHIWQSTLLFENLLTGLFADD